MPILEATISSVLPSISKLSATSGAVDQLSPLWGGSVKDELGKLERSLNAIKLIIRNAEERQFAEDAVKSWLLDLHIDVCDAEDALDAFDIELRRRLRRQRSAVDKLRDVFRRRVFEFKQLREVRDVTKRIEKAVREMAQFNFRTMEQQMPRLPLSRPRVGPLLCEDDIVGRGEDRDSVVCSLISSEEGRQHHLCNGLVEVISIWGMGGVGKTTLAQMVYKDERVVNHFELRMWVSAPVDFDVGENVGEIVGEMINSATGESFLDLSRSMQELLEKKLKNVLSKKRYLIVLDDVWNEDWRKWDNLYRILIACEGHQGSRILATSRNERCLQVMMSQLRHNLSYLSVDNSWDLFSLLAFSTSQPNEDLIFIGKEIVQKCRGLPLGHKSHW